MTKQLFGKRKIITQEGRRLVFSYYKLHTRLGYGVCVADQDDDCAAVTGVAEEEMEIERFLHLLMKGRVSPVSLEDVAKDWREVRCGIE